MKHLIFLAALTILIPLCSCGNDLINDPNTDIILGKNGVSVTSLTEGVIKLDHYIFNPINLPATYLDLKGAVTYTIETSTPIDRSANLIIKMRIDATLKCPTPNDRSSCMRIYQETIDYVQLNPGGYKVLIKNYEISGQCYGLHLRCEYTVTESEIFLKRMELRCPVVGFTDNFSDL